MQYYYRTRKRLDQFFKWSVFYQLLDAYRREIKLYSLPRVSVKLSFFSCIHNQLLSNSNHILESKLLTTQIDKCRIAPCFRRYQEYLRCTHRQSSYQIGFLESFPYTLFISLIIPYVINDMTEQQKETHTFLKIWNF